MKQTIWDFYNTHTVPCNVGIGIFTGLCFFIFMTPFNIASTKLGQYDIYLRIPLVAIMFCAYAAEFYQTRKIDKFLVIFNIYAFILLIATLRSHADIASAVWGRWIVTDAFIILFLLGMGKNQKFFLLSIYITLYLMILWDISTTWVPKEQWGSGYENLLFGNYNYKAIYYFPALIVGYINYIWYRNNKGIRISFFLLELLILITLFYVGSMTSTVVFTIFIFYLNVLNREKTFKIFNIWMYLIFNAAFFYFIVFKEYTGGLIAEILKSIGKAPTFSGRTPVWNVTKEFIAKEPLIGYGVWVPANRRLFLNDVPASTHAHNFYLNTAFESGLLGIICKGYLAGLGIQNACKIENGKIKGCLMAGLGLYLFAVMFESYHDMSFLSIIMVMYFFQTEPEQKKL